MTLVIPLSAVTAKGRPLVGEKCFNLARLSRKEFAVPPTLCVTTAAYEAFVAETGLKERIQLELSRKDLDAMRWEELWDAALRIRTMFLREGIPPRLEKVLRRDLADFADAPAAVRSSAPGEDAPGSSFAGLHESFVDIRGADSILEHLRLVWASLWSDAALLYRRELNLDLEKSVMAAAVQRFVEGERSGVAFSVSPTDSTAVSVEAVHGLNEGLVDGTVDPDRWNVDRESGRVTGHVRPQSPAGSPPLTEEEVAHVSRVALRAERLFGSPQDVEWTLAGDALTLLQSRPITTLAAEGEDDARGWYLSLRRSLGNLKALKGKIEDELIPSMRKEAALLSEENLKSLEDIELAREIGRRVEIVDGWKSRYREYFIPFAHGMRLFGQVYNRVMRPDDPYQFMTLLGGGRMESLERNRALESLAARLRKDAGLAEAVRIGDEIGDEEYRRARQGFVERYGDLSCRATGGAGCAEEERILDMILLEMAGHPPREAGGGGEGEALAESFIERYPGGDRKLAEEILELGRASYRLRDDDNIHLGRIEAGLTAALNEGLRRLKDRGGDAGDDEEPSAVAAALGDPGRLQPKRSRPPEEREERDRIPVRARQLVGQPAGPGLGAGTARVITRHAELAGFRKGEILVCDAVDPNMTFVIPLAAGVVERRGGMLIHGAIIAREYGLPCVTGIEGATARLHTGDELTVDGYLGIVTVRSVR